MLFIEYPKCSTCQKAKKWLDANHISYIDRHIVENNPTYEELKQWYERSGLPLKKFFNTSGMLYKELQLKDKLPGMSEEEQLKLLEDVLDEQSIKKEEIADLLILEQQLSYALSVLCDKKHIWEMFRIMDCDMLRANYLYYSTYGFQAERYYGPSGWEHMQIEGRMLLDHLKRKDTEAAALICSSHFDRILLNTNSIQGFYPQFFSG